MTRQQRLKHILRRLLPFPLWTFGMAVYRMGCILAMIGLSLGARKRLLKATAELRAAEPAVAPSAAAPSAAALSAETAASLTIEAQRRPLTIMFCDLIGSTSLSEQLDPEDLREIMHAYQRLCARSIERFDGYVARYMGDGVLAYFGYPRAHEDDAERALRAGLDLIEAMGPLDASHDVDLRVRIGVATGMVVVGEVIGTATAEQRAVVGETPNLAARLQGLATPNTMVISPGTHLLIGDAFECEHLGKHDIKGFKEPTPLWRVVSTRQTESRFDATRGADLTPLVGRQQEIGLLRERWGLAVKGEGQAALLSGEPGIGKSRIIEALCEELREQLGGAPHTRIRYQCSPYHSSTAFYPFLDQLERVTRIGHKDPPDANLARIDSHLRGDDVSRARLVPLIATLLGVALTAQYPPLELTPTAQKEALIDGLIEQLELLASTEPVLLIFEDLHWIDPTALELLTRMIDAAQASRVLVVVTFRPEFRSPWVGRGHITSLTLNRFGSQQIAAMIDRVTGHRRLPDEVVRQIAAKTDGVPLFVEELTKTVLESGILRREDDAYLLKGPLPPLAIPATLHDSLETGQAFEGARALADELGDEPSLTRALYGEFGSSFNGARLASARDAAEDLLRLGEKTGDVPRRVIGHQALGLACFALGEQTTAREQLEEALGLEVDRDDETLNRAQFPSTTMVYLSRTLFVLGDVSRAVESCDASIRTAREESPFALAIGLGNACNLHQFRLEREVLRETTAQLVELATEKAMPVWLGLGRFFSGWLDAGHSTTAQDLETMTNALKSICDKGQLIERPHLLGVLAEAYAHVGEPSQALTVLDDALGQVKATGERWLEPELLRIKGETLARVRGADDATAQRSLLGAVQLARAQGARMWELRAAVSRCEVARGATVEADTQENAGELLVAAKALAALCDELPDDALNGDLKRARSLRAVG